MIVGAMLARNEAAPDRYLQRVLDNLHSFCDDVVVLDDGSTDDTREVSRAAGCRVADVAQLANTGTSANDDIRTGFWGRDESTPRKLLWEIATGLAGTDGWIYIADADHELIDITPDEMRALTTTDHLNAWAWPLLDCWDSDETHRIDGYWQAWRMPRAWMFRAQPEVGFHPHWGDSRAIHAGHAPQYHWRAGIAPGYIRHLGYVSKRHRELKLTRYLELA